MEITTYLTENLLENILKDFCSYNKNYIFIGKQIRLPQMKKFAFDYELQKNNNRIFIEFDGFRHYNDAYTIFNDTRKNNLIKELGYSLIRIPYFVQLDSITFQYYFNESFHISTSFPHGFIDEKALLPASFCKLGLERFEKELELLPKNIKEEIINSLYNKSKEKNLPIIYIYK